MPKDDPVADALRSIAGAVQRLGNANASTDYGGLEAHGMAITSSAERIAEALEDVASAIRELAEAGAKTNSR